MPDKRATFFRIIFGENQGYVCISRRAPGTRTFREEWFRYPDDVDTLVAYIIKHTTTEDVYYCPMLFDADRKRRKENVVTCPSIWADLDTCPPEKLLVQPTITVQSSPGRYQALWVLDEPIEPHVAEDVCRRIAYYHADEGADKTGWDLTQLLRPPATLNHKYSMNGPAPLVDVKGTGDQGYTLKDFDDYPPVAGYEYEQIPYPETLPNLSAEDILEEHRVLMPQQVWILFGQTPDEDWSKALWTLELLLAEEGMSREEMFIVCREAACNKFRRDGRPENLLWRDVCKAFATNEHNKSLLPGKGPVGERLDPLLTDAEVDIVVTDQSFVERYIEWAKTLGDAAPQYHQAGAFVILSSLLAGTVRLPTSYGLVVPNLWFMILADTTLTRKTTAMDIAVDLLVEVDSDAVLATDGSIEGLMTSLSMRPGRPSIFLRDEFSGLLEMMNKKDYYAGMAESFTKLYDGKFQKRVLRKETLEVRDPVLILFAGGIRTRILELLSVEQIASGFIPRFAFISADSDPTRVRPLGPPREQSVDGRNTILEDMRRFHRHYNRTEVMRIGDKEIASPKRWDASMTDAAWARYNQLEAKMMDAGLSSPRSDLLMPMFDRLCKTGLKCAVLLACARSQEDRVVVQVEDIARAFYYVEQWRNYSVMVLENVGWNRSEKQIDAALKTIQRLGPDVPRSTVMQRLHLTAREADQIFLTLEQRAVIVRHKKGRAERFSAT